MKNRSNISEHSEDVGKPQWRLRSTDAEQGDTQTPRAHRAGIESTAIGALTGVTAHWAARLPLSAPSKRIFVHLLLA